MKKLDTLITYASNLQYKAILYLFCLIGNILDLHRRTKKDVRKEYQKQFADLRYPVKYKC